MSYRWSWSAPTAELCARARTKTPTFSGAFEAAARPLKSFGRPVLDTIGPMTYCGLNAMLDGGYPKGAFNYWKSHFLRELSNDAVATMIDAFEQCPSPMSGILLEHFHGAATR